MQYQFKIPDNEETELCKYVINQQDNMLFRQIRLITGDFNKTNKYIVFVNCKGGKNHADALSEIVRNGFYLGNTHYVMSERSASMVRTSILSFVDESISDELYRRVTMDIKIEKTVLSKWYAYRGLMLSSCHCLEDWVPRIIIVPDCYRVIPRQKIRYAYDYETTYEKDGKIFPWTQKDITTGVRDIEICVTDGCGIHHPDITDQVRGMLDAKSDPTSILWRAPFIKGVTHEMDYPTFFAERGITAIKDVWGVSHDVTHRAEPAIIMAESMYKGFKYFKRNNDYRDWQHYWDMFHKYNHCIGVAKWNFSLEEEPVYTRGNYQILQDLQLPYAQFATLAKTSIDWVNDIVNGDPIALYVFLGLFADSHKELNLRMEALVKNREMIKEAGVRQYILSLINKSINEMKCGKIYLKSCFKFLAPDLIMFMEHVGGISLNGCLDDNEFFTFNKFGEYSGEYLIERNPHISKSEHVILNAANNTLTKRYCSHLVNVCMVNSKSITPQRLNGADFDGDLVLVIDNEMMKSGVDRNSAIVIDIEDKVTSLAEEDTLENKVKVILRDKSNMIGEVSNYATTYHNKTPRSIETKDMYDSYVCLLSIINGKVIDSSKTGVIYNVPRHIAKFGRPLPYFMKYASPYYFSMKNLSHSQSNMNRLCKDIEHWHREHRWKVTYRDFDYKIMVDDSIPFNEYRFNRIEELFIAFNKEIAASLRQVKKALAKNANRKSKSKEPYEYVEDINWQGFYNSYRKKCFDICPDICELANYATRLCYEVYPKRRKTFLWVVAGEGILANLQQTEQYLPIRDPNGEYEYLGNRYRMEKIVFD